jgi:hypothetical protein
MFRLTIANQAWEPTSKVTRFAPSPLGVGGKPQGQRIRITGAYPPHPANALPRLTSPDAATLELKPSRTRKTSRTPKGCKLELDKEILAESNSSTNEKTADE